MPSAKIKQSDGTWLTVGVGPQGPAGATGATGSTGATGAAGSAGAAGSKGVIFQIPGPVVTSTGSLRIYNDSGVTKTIAAIRATLVTAGTTATTVDINKNGTTVFTTQANRPSLGSGTVTQKVTNMDVTSWANGEYLTLDVDAAGTGADTLIVQIEA